MRPAIRERVIAFLAIAVLAGLLFYQRGENDQLRDAERQAVNAYRGARAQTDGALEIIGTLRDSLATAGRRTDTVLVRLAGVSDTIRERVASSPSPDSVTISKLQMLAWADKIDLAVNEVSRYRVQVDSLLAAQGVLVTLHQAERAAADSLLRIKDLRIKAERKQGRKEGAVVGAGLILVGWLLIK